MTTSLGVKSVAVRKTSRRMRKRHSPAALAPTEAFFPLIGSLGARWDAVLVHRECRGLPASDKNPNRISGLRPLPRLQQFYSRCERLHSLFCLRTRRNPVCTRSEPSRQQGRHFSALVFVDGRRLINMEKNNKKNACDKRRRSEAFQCTNTQRSCLHWHLCEDFYWTNAFSATWAFKSSWHAST